MNRREFLSGMLGTGLAVGTGAARAAFPALTRPDKAQRIADALRSIAMKPPPSPKSGLLMGIKAQSPVNTGTMGRSLSRLGKPMKDFNIGDISGLR